MAVLSSIDFKVTFEFDKSPETFKIEDTTDYASQGVDKANVDGVLKIVDPTGTTIYNNNDYTSPDIDPDSSLVDTADVELPKDGNGDVIQGKYTITYSVEHDHSATTDVVENEKTFDLDYTAPSVDLDMEVNCVKPLLTSTDNTNYTVNGTDPSITRDHDIHYPSSLNKTKVDGSTKKVETDTFYTKEGEGLEHSSSLTSDLTYTFSSDFLVTDQVTGSAVKNVLCDGQLCDIYCCLRAQWKRWKDATNDRKKSEELEKFGKMMDLADMLGYSIECDKGGDTSDFVSQIQDIGNCEAGCGCNDGEPQLVTGLGITGSDVVVEEGTKVKVTSSTSGGVTTYTVSLSSSAADKIDNLRNSKVQSGDGISVNETTESDGTKVYTVKNTQTSDNPDICNTVISFDFNDSSNPVGISKDNNKVYGPNLKSPTITDESPSSGNTITGNNKFKVSNFFSGSDVPYYNMAQIVDVVYDTSVLADSDDEGNQVKLELFDKDTSEFYMRFIDPDGYILSNTRIENLDTVKIVLKIEA